MHTMTMINEHEGTEEWICSTCGRHLLISWNPKFIRTVLLEGDPSAKHSGSKSDLLRIDTMDVSVNKALPPKNIKSPKDETRLMPWLSWMDESGFENLWNSDAR